MKGEQLELSLWQEMRQAQQMPETVAVVEVLDAVEATTAQLPEAERLQFTGEALLQIAELCATRAGLLITEWEKAYRDPTVPRGFFDDLVRQTMTIDLTELMEPAPPRQPRTRRAKSNQTEGSIAAVVDKAAVLEMLEQLEVAEAEEEERRQQVLGIAHDENVLQWSAARCSADTARVAQWLRAMPTHQAFFAHLCQSLGMPRVEVWLGVPLGEFELERGEEFYSDAIWVRPVSVDV